MYCGVNPSEIEKMDITEIELFMVYFSELQRAKAGELNGRK